MSHTHARVPRGGTNVLRFPGVVLRFQQIPGVDGPPEERAIARLPYSVLVGRRG